MNDFENYLSPFSWRYGSIEMRSIWSEIHKRLLWRRIWLALAETEAEFDLVSFDQVDDLRAHVSDVNIKRSLEIEAEIHHDLMAELRSFSEQCPTGGGILHLGATSTDIEDNADVLRICQSLDLALDRLEQLLRLFSEKIKLWSETPLIAFTHLQPAEPSTLGYRLAQYAQDLLTDWQSLQEVRRHLRGKGFKGAVGTGAAYSDLVGVDRLADFEARLSEKLDLPFFPIATQTYPRKQDYLVVSSLAGIACTVNKFAFDLRILQSPPIGEWAEPFGKKQVGSSAMPFKRNPVNAEKINSLARWLAQLPRLAWDNAANSLLERTLDDSANRRILLPEAFLGTDELLKATATIVEGLQIDSSALGRNLSIYAPFAATERVLVALGKSGADRQAMHERLRQHAMQAWEAVRSGLPNPLMELILNDEVFHVYLPEAKLRSLMDASLHLGDAPARARAMSKFILDSIE
jgi:adenylosuccinate lyase